MFVHSKFLKKIVVFALCVITSVSMVACAPSGGNDGTQVVMDFIMVKSGLGESVFENQATRFNNLYATKEYDGGKVGTKLEIVPSNAVQLSVDQSTTQDGYHFFYASDEYTSVKTAADNGWILDIDNIVRTKIPGEERTILDKIDPSIRNNFSVEDSSKPDGRRYYAIPTADYYGGLSYDTELFKKGYYFASPDAEDYELYESRILGYGYNYKFTSNMEQLSVGPNGKAGDLDDGLPSSLYELIVLCEKLKEDGISPFILTGSHEEYSNLFADGLWTALHGYENSYAIKNFTSSGMDIVVGFTDDDLFPGLEGIKKPITTRVDVDLASGYYTTHSLEKYYVYAFMELIEKEEWYSAAANTNKTHIEAQADFIFGIQANERARQGAMLFEGSYWYNESVIRKNFQDYKRTYKNAPDRDVNWMSLPVNIFTTVTGEDGYVENDICKESTLGEPMTMATVSTGFFAVNAMYKNDAATMEAIKDFLLFRYSDAELSKTAAETGYKELLIYDVKSDDLVDAPQYIKNFFEMTKDAKVCPPYASNIVMDVKGVDFVMGYSSKFFSYGTATNARQLVKDYTVMKAFENKLIDKNGWNSYYKTEQMATPKYYPTGHAKAGQEIKFEK